MHNHWVEWVVTIGAAGVLFVTVAGSMLRATRRAAQWQGHVEARWREVAQALGGTLEVGRSASLTPRRLALSVPSQDARVTVEANVPVDSGAPSFTRAHARFALGEGPVFRLWERTGADGIGDEREILGDPVLARRVRIETEHPEAMGALFSAGAQTHASGFLRPLDVRSDGQTVELVWDGTELDPATLSHALGLVRELASYGTATLHGLVALEGATYVPAGEEPPRVRVFRERVEVELMARTSAGALEYLAVAMPTRALPAFEVRVEDGEVVGAIPPGMIDPDVAPYLAELGACSLSSTSGALELSWDAAPDATQGEAAVRILASIAGGSGRQGAFR